jgi:iron(II)-dependent oxidoreductase
MQTIPTDTTAARDGVLRDRLAALLEECRARTFALIEPLGDDDLRRQHDRLMSPIIWDVGHIGNFEDLWGVRSFPGAGAAMAALDPMYDPMINPRAVRDRLPLPTLAGARRDLDTIRRRVLELLAVADLDGADPLLRGGYLYQMLLQHEYQHDETILATLQLKHGEPYHPAVRRSLPCGNPSVGGTVSIPAGEYPIGTDDRSVAYDNERPQHRVRLDSFDIGVAPVSNGEFETFVEAGGYRTRSLWSDEGWAFIIDQGIEAPKHWMRDDDGAWTTRSMDVVEPLNRRRPVVHVCWHETQAYCRWAGCRLPSEAEWEVAASFDPATATHRAYPWGDEWPTPDHANLDQLAFMAAEIGAYPRGVSAFGCHQMLGDVWEWTASDFRGYPGFEAFPYDEYSKVFFGSDYMVLRGGSWATRPGAIRTTFRNWDFPIRRQIFSGFRIALS